MAKILIVDDESDIRELLELTLTRMGLDTFSATNVEESKQALSKDTFDVCLTDMRLPDGDGLDLIAHIQSHYPDLPVAMITAHGNMETAIKAMKLGAFDFVSKPIDLAQLRSMVKNALKLSEQSEKQSELSKNRSDQSTNKNPVENKTNADNLTPSQQERLLIGSSKAMDDLNELIIKVARSQASVYIHGESGTGKELVARSIHNYSPRNNGPFVPVNCSAIPSELLESEFFGHLKGSFTGANTDKEGLFKSAHGGTLFLDEVADLPISMQVKLLRAIQEKSVRPVGGNTEELVDVRILSASHKDLAQLVDDNYFRQDLFYRINVIRIDVPPLKARGSDVMEITKYVLDKISKRDDVEPALSLTSHAKQALANYSFPGNVRELENILERASALCSPPHIDEFDLQLPTTPKEKTDHTPNLDDKLADSESEQILIALEQTKGNKTKAAELLGLSFRQLRYRIKKLGL